MVTFTVHRDYGFDLTKIDFSGLYFGEDYSTSSTRFAIDYGYGYREVLSGFGLRYSGDTPYSGTVNSFSAQLDGVEVLRMDGLNLSVNALMQTANTWDNYDDVVLVGNAMSGNDRFTGGNGADVFAGFQGNDTLGGNGGSDTLWGDNGNDQLFGGAGSDELIGGGDSDRLWGGDGLDTLWGEDGFDSLFGGAGHDTLYGAGGRDLLEGGSGNDVLDGGSWHDTLRGQAGADGIWAGAGDDVLIGGDGNDLLSGGLGHDTLSGERGNDRIYGNTGPDLLSGGLGADRFVFDAVSDSARGAADRITDFSRNHGDKINLGGIDADHGLAGNNGFRFIGTGAFSGDAGQLRYQVNAAGVSVQADVNGDGIADLVLQVDHLRMMQASDFML